MGPRRRSALLLLAALGAAAAPLAAGPAAEARADYERLQEWRYEVAGRELPAGGIAFGVDVAGWRLETGRLWLGEPAEDGAVTGLVFEGRGVFRMEVPDPVERAQLRRFVGEPELEVLEQPFTRLVLRASDPRRVAEAAAGAVPAAPYRTHKLARERHEFWLRIHRVDADAAVAAARHDGIGGYVRAAMKTADHGWLTWEHDPRRPEEVRLTRYYPRFSFVESWVSLDRAPDRRADGRPGALPRAPWDVQRVDIEARLLKLGKDPGLSETARHTLTAEIRAAVELEPLHPSRRAVQLYLVPTARVSAVRDAGGRELPFLRDPIGRRSSAIDKRIHDVSLVVLLDEPPEPGRPLRLVFDYELDVANYVPGRLWYPGAEHLEAGLTDLHTARLRITTRDGYEIRAMGEPVDETVERGLKTAVWEVAEPAKMVTFAIARKVEEQRLEAPGLPPVIVFSPPLGHDTENRLHDLGADVVNSYAFFRDLFGEPDRSDRLYATLIQAFHGQAFDGFLHLPESSAFRPRRGPTERLVAHEVAHLWWGHQVGFATYRDQWLSEGLAQYSALLYLEAAVEQGEKLFRQALKAFRDEVTGSVGSTMSPFSRSGLALDNQAAQRRIGPVGLGARAAVGESPAAYLTLAYRKAALVVHMLRALLRRVEGDDALFARVLRRFAERHRGAHPATADLAAVVSELAPGDWSWFFHQWIERAEMPSYEWKATLPTAAGPDGAFPLRLEILQSGVPDDFRMLLPVRVELAGGEERDYLVEVEGPRTESTLALPAAPRRVRVDPDRDLLARVIPSRGR